MVLKGRVAKITTAGMAIIAVPHSWRRIGDVVEVKLTDAERDWYVDMPVQVEITECSGHLDNSK